MAEDAGTESGQPGVVVSGPAGPDGAEPLMSVPLFSSSVCLGSQAPWWLLGVWSRAPSEVHSLYLSLMLSLRVHGACWGEVGTWPLS